MTASLDLVRLLPYKAILSAILTTPLTFWMRFIRKRYLSTYYTDVEVPKRAIDGYENTPTLVGMANVFVNELGYVWNEKVRKGPRKEHRGSQIVRTALVFSFMSIVANWRDFLCDVLKGIQHCCANVGRLEALVFLEAPFSLVFLAAVRPSPKNYIVPKSCWTYKFGPRASTSLPTNAKNYEKVCMLNRSERPVPNSLVKPPSCERHALNFLNLARQWELAFDGLHLNYRNVLVPANIFNLLHHHFAL